MCNVGCTGIDLVLTVMFCPQDSEASIEDAASLDTSHPPEHSPAAHWQNSGGGLRRLRRITDVYPEVIVATSRHP